VVPVLDLAGSEPREQRVRNSSFARANHDLGLTEGEARADQPGPTTVQFAALIFSSMLFICAGLGGGLDR
jgi:hypothetical protein